VSRRLPIGAHPMKVNLEVAAIPVSEVDRALKLYRDRLGRRLDADIS
jgi:catechol 2,3-dioxygenase-like lactoylglutathione lyase family enzyme